MEHTAVIMAGGKGERFWPRSRRNMPKQFLSVTDDGLTMIQLTAKRLLPLVKYEDIFVVTNVDYVDLVQKQLPEIPIENILAEPIGRNTAPAIGLAAVVISQKYDDAIMLVLASDHLIKNDDLYIDTIILASSFAEEDEKLLTIGITPNYPETGYGYINFGKEYTSDHHSGAYKVKRFVEKPDLETAKEYLASGDYLWNSGMFVWKTSTILKKFKELIPDTYRGLLRILESFGSSKQDQIMLEEFTGFKSESVDYAILERATNIYTIPGNFGWDDVGTWLAMERINRTSDKGNVVQGDVITLDTENSIIIGNNKLIATIGIEDIIIIDTEDAILICDKDHAQDIKRVIEHLKISNRNELL